MYYVAPREPGPTDDYPPQLGAWALDARCLDADPEAFFPEKGGSTLPGKAVCGRCDVRDACLEYALTNDVRDGIWGGLGQRERTRLKRKREQRARAV